ncbi:response regulator transcription factor [Vagococcus fluvialis]|nr:response regulator transcription factor [Vagococcus fluvialis]UDM75481.1 response regulator transcription factor [Vagococcus fluvialis]
MMKILLIEDDTKLRELTKIHLEKYGFVVFAITNFDSIVDTFKEVEPHLVLMDINLPIHDGFYWTRQLRKVTKCPIIFLSARDSQMDQVMALEYGGDDYLVKPFSYDILLAKIKSHLRRSYGEYSDLKEERTIKKEQLIFYPERLEVHVLEKQELLSQKEGQLLEILMESYPEVVSRQDLLSQIWDDEHFVDDNTLSVNMTRLRRKLEQLGLADSILTVRGRGYRLLL